MDNETICKRLLGCFTDITPLGQIHLKHGDINREVDMYDISGNYRIAMVDRKLLVFWEGIDFRKLHIARGYHTCEPKRDPKVTHILKQPGEIIHILKTYCEIDIKNVDSFKLLDLISAVTYKTEVLYLEDAFKDYPTRTVEFALNCIPTWGTVAGDKGTLSGTNKDMK